MGLLNKSYAGAVFVVYEDLYVIQRYDGADDRSIVASHTDINDDYLLHDHVIRR